MEKAIGGSFARTTRNTDEDEGRREGDWDMTLNRYPVKDRADLQIAL